MSNRIEKMLAKTAGLRATSDIPQEEVSMPARPRTAVGMTAALQATQLRIQELEEQAARGGQTIIPVDRIAPNPWQPRTVFDERKIRELAASIAATGLIQPIVVRRVGGLVTSVPSGDTLASPEKVSPEGTLYELVAGERRLRAHKSLSLAEIKALIVEVADEDMALMALSENIDREDLCDFEIAKAIQRAEDEFPSRKRMAEALGMGRNEMYRYLDFFKLPSFVLADLEQNPGLLTRHSAEAIRAVIGEKGEKAAAALQRIWVRVKSGDLPHPRIAEAIQASLARGPHRERDIKKLFVGKEQAGSITRDGNGLTVKIRATALTSENEVEIRTFMERMFS